MRIQAGKSLSEYLLILVLVSVIAIPSLIFLSDTLQDETQNVSTAHNKGMSQLLTLLDTETKPVETIAALGDDENSYSSNQPVSDLTFNYNATTGLVEIINTASGTETTSSEGTTILVQALQSIIDDSADSLTNEQSHLLNQLTQDGLAIAEEEQRLYDDPNTGYASGEPANLVFFSNSEASTLYQDFLTYSNTYQTLINSFEDSNAENPAQNAIEINSSVISQLAVQNFIQVQLELDAGHPGIIPYLNATEENVIRDHNIDITQITVEETAALTETATNNKQTGTHTDFRGRENNNRNSKNKNKKRNDVE